MREGLLILLTVAPFAAAQAPPRVELEVQPATFPPLFSRPAPNCPPPSPQMWPSLPGTPGMPANPSNPGATPNPMDPANPNANQNQNPNADPGSNAFAQSGESGGTASSSFNESFNGDFAGIIVCRRVVVGFAPRPPLSSSLELPPTPTGFDPIYANFCTFLATRYNGILITDNDGPRPTDRAYFGYNYYNTVNPTLNPGLPGIDMHRETVGFEKTFAGGNASFGMRLPFIQVGDPLNAGQRTAGDLSLLLKYAFYNDLQTGDLLSLGMILTTPTGGTGDVQLMDGTSVPNAVLFQPWMGGVKMYQNWYVQAITSYVIPTSSQLPTLANNSVAAGYFLYRNATDRLIQAVIPTLEVHSRNPLTFRDASAPIYLQDQLNLTFGVHLRTAAATLSPAITVPTMGPNPFKSEVSVWLNVRF